MEEADENYAVDIADLVQLREKHPDWGICPVCSNGQWYAMQGPDQVIAILAEGKAGEPPSEIHPLVAISCRRCGFLKMHIKQTFDAYVAAIKDGRDE